MKTLPIYCLLLACLTGCVAPRMDADNGESQAAARMIRASETTLAPVYVPLAEHLVQALDLADADGVGIDLGSGPGTLIVELCQRTRMHWINADLNPCFFPYFYRLATARGVAERVSAIRADAQDLPFRGNYADVVVSRGCFHFWPDRAAGFREIYRVLKPGGVAYIGRGFPPNLPVAPARTIRDKQRRHWQYDSAAAGRELAAMLRGFGVQDIRVHTPQPEGSEGINYGVWIEFRKPAAGPVQ